ncbi:MAG: hypothetical protein ACWGSQ_19655, partial [Longimicrobiales bacterium]
ELDQPISLAELDEGLPEGQVERAAPLRHGRGTLVDGVGEVLGLLPPGQNEKIATQLGGARCRSGTC